MPGTVLLKTQDADGDFSFSYRLHLPPRVSVTTVFPWARLASRFKGSPSTLQVHLLDKLSCSQHPCLLVRVELRMAGSASDSSTWSGKGAQKERQGQYSGWGNPVCKIRVYVWGQM